MKRLSLTRILRVLRHAPYLCVLPLHQSLVPASSGMVIAILFVVASFLAHGLASCSRSRRKEFFSFVFFLCSLLCIDDHGSFVI